MKTTIALALSALLANSLVVAYPSKRNEHAHLHKKRNLVVVTEEVYETVYSTTTIWVDPTAGGEFYEQPQAKSTEHASSYAAASSPVAASAVPYVAPSSSSVYAVPYVAPSSPSVYVAPSSVYVAPSSAAAVSSSTPTPSPSSVYVAPSSAYVAATPTEATSSAAVSAAATPSAGAYTGDVTYYNPAGGYGACGFVIADSDPVVAIAHDTWDTKGMISNGNPWCKQKIIITNLSTGKTFPATIGDKCMGTDAAPCTGGNLDLTQGLFEQAFPEVDGRGKGVMSWVLA